MRGAGAEYSTICTLYRVDECMSNRKQRETKQQPSMLPCLAVLGCCLVSFHFLRDIHSIHPVHVASALMRARLWPPEWARGERVRFLKERERRRERGEKLCNSPGYFSLSNERAHLPPSLPPSALSFLCALHLAHLTILLLPPLFPCPLFS